MNFQVCLSSYKAIVYPGIEIFVELFQLSIIIYANVIIADLIWLTKLRNNPEARTSLQEVIASETLVAVASEWLE